MGPAVGVAGALGGALVAVGAGAPVPLAQAAGNWSHVNQLQSATSQSAPQDVQVQSPSSGQLELSVWRTVRSRGKLKWPSRAMSTMEAMAVRERVEAHVARRRRWVNAMFWVRMMFE